MAFRIEYCRDRIAATFPDHDNNLALAVLVPGLAAITAMCFDIRGLDVAPRSEAEDDAGLLAEDLR